MSNEALSSLAKFVPDLLDYSEDNKMIDFSKDIESQLITLLKLDKSDVEYINSNLTVV